MSDLTIKTWVNQESAMFDNFTVPMATRFEEGIFKSIAQYLREVLHAKGHAECKMPWGTYTADMVVKGETANINVSWEPSKGFLKILNGENMDNAQKVELITQDEFDPAYMTLFRDYVAYGFFNPNAPENKDRANKNKCVRLTEEQAIYFLNSWALVLATIGKEKQRDGKLFRLEVNTTFAHGFFDFDYDDEIKVTFTADKAFKQILKDDDAAETAMSTNMTAVKDGIRKEVTAIED